MHEQFRRRRFGQTRCKLLALPSVLVLFFVGVFALCPALTRQLAGRDVTARLGRLAVGDRLCAEAGAFDVTLSRRTQRLGPLLAGWETVGGCGAGGAGAGGGSVRWIGRGVRGGLFDVQSLSSYMHIGSNPANQEFHGGFNFSTSTQISRDFDQKWSGTVVIPVLYKYYRDYLRLEPTRDVSIGGLGDINLIATRKLGPINATKLSLGVGLPTGLHDGRYKTSLITQEKQLGFGRFTGNLTLEHAFDEIWGVIVVGGVASYRGGTNNLESYRAPSGSLFGFTGYYLGGSLMLGGGATVTGFSAHDRDVNEEQPTSLLTIAPSASIEWSNDLVAVLLGGSVPFGKLEWASGGLVRQPWVIALGVAVSPF